MAPNALQFLMFGLSTPFKIDELGSPPSNFFLSYKAKTPFLWLIIPDLEHFRNILKLNQINTPVNEGLFGRLVKLKAKGLTTIPEQINHFLSCHLQSLQCHDYSLPHYRHHRLHLLHHHHHHHHYPCQLH